VTDRGSPLYPEAPKRHRIYQGLRTERQEHIFNWMAVVVVLLYVTGWIAAVTESRRVRNTPVPVRGGEHLEPPAPPPTPAQAIAEEFFGPQTTKAPPFLAEAFAELLNPLRGKSGELRYVPLLPGSRVIQGQAAPPVAITSRPGEARAPAKPGIYEFSVGNRPAGEMRIVTLVPRSQKQGGRIGRYQLGTWPFEGGGRPRSPRYAAPQGFIEVTQQNQNFQVSEHFQLRQFLTKDQHGVWPKYLPLDPLLIDKLELTIQELQKEGVRVEHVHVMSGFRTPRYNAGGGNTSGRANLSRHMYGDGADVYVDNNRDGHPDDITGDGRVTVRDAEKFAAAAERVEKKHPSLVGGIGIYVACCGHGPFTHIDVRGNRARWRGSGSG
jgi:Bacterial protein of unknown function (DUF882)